nr:hypothetical protein [Microbacterium proteolyticum]
MSDAETDEADVDTELASMQAIVDALEPLNEVVQKRILRWVEARYPF